jgi:YD repeat-containing protein
MVTSVTAVLAGSSTVNVSFAYDAAGNRTRMDDMQGWTVYEYDQLSRLKSENRHFNGVSHPSSADQNYKLSYTYSLSGQLASLTDPFNSTVTYSHDKTGKLSGVGGSYGGVTSYVSNVQYRAWGAVKSASFGNGSSETITYDTKLQPSGIRLTNGGTSLLREDYSYFSDGRLSHITDLDDTGGTNPPDTVRFMSRTFAYDHVGRVASLNSSPSSQYYSYDTFDNLTSRNGNYNWESSQTDTASYANNKRSGWDYDPDGRLTVSPANSTSTARNWTYNSAGQQASVVDSPGSSNASTYGPAYDGDGRIVYDATTGSSFSSVDYLVLSSVLGGAVISKVDGSGNKILTNVQAGGLVFPLLNPDVGYGLSVTWIQRNPQGVTEVGGGGYAGMAAYDPLGNYVPLGQHPPSPHPPATIIGPYYETASAYMSNANNYSTGCMAASGNPQDCSNISKRQQMTDEFKSNLPDAHHDMWEGENRYVTFANWASRQPDGKSTSGVEWVHITDTNGLTAKTSFAHVALPQDPIVVGATPDEEVLIGAGHAEALKRLHLEPCARLFGGADKGAQTLNGIAWVIKRDLPANGHPGAIVGEGTYDYINPNGAFLTPDGSTWTFGLAEPSGKQGYQITLTGAQARAFGELHEGVHKGKAHGFKGTDNDDRRHSTVNGIINNYKIWKACFPEVTAKPTSTLPPY